VTGGAGFIGSNIVEYLLKYGASVRVLDNLSNGYYRNIEPFINNPKFEFWEGDIRDFNTCQRAMQGIDFVSHQAALGSVPRSIRDPLTTNAVNIDGFLNVLHAVKENRRVKRMVYATSSSVYGNSKKLPKVEGQEGDPLSPYAVSKQVNEFYAEIYSKVYGLSTVGLRYFNVFGPKQAPDNPYAAAIPIFIKAAIDGKPPTINGDGQTTRDFTFVENAVQANIKAMLNSKELVKHEVVNIALGGKITLIDLWNAICQIKGDHIEPHFGPERAGDVKESLANINKAKKVIGYNPEIELAEGLKLTYDYVKEHF
jgi:UDP-N-acetylglucosamine 4-epimerase